MHVNHLFQRGSKEPTIADFHFLSQWVCTPVSFPTPSALPGRHRTDYTLDKKVDLANWWHYVKTAETSLIHRHLNNTKLYSVEFLRTEMTSDPSN